MAIIKLKVFYYAYISLKEDGTFTTTYGHNSYRGDGEAVYSKDYNSITIPLGMKELEFEAPDDIRPLAASVLDKYRDKVKAEHYALLTRMEFARNAMLQLAAPEVLDAENPARRLDSDIEDVELKPVCVRDDMQQFGDNNHHPDDDFPF